MNGCNTLMHTFLSELILIMTAFVCMIKIFMLVLFIYMVDAELSKRTVQYTEKG